MKYDLGQISVDEFLKTYLPGSDIPDEFLDNLHYIKDASSLLPEWRLKPEICRLADNVASCKHRPAGEESKEASAGKNAHEYPIVTRDIANWSVVTKKKRGVDEDAASLTSNKSASGDPDGKPSTRVDVGVFFNDERFKEIVHMSPGDFVKKTTMSSDADKNERKDTVGRRSWADIVVPIEVKINSKKTAFYFDDTDPSKFLRTDSNDGREALDHISEYVGQILCHQHRVHLYSVYIYQERARLLYVDRQGVLVSEPFKYGTRNHLTLHTFFWRLAHMSREQLGFDSTVVPAELNDVKKMLEYAPHAPTDYIEQQIYHTLSVDPKRPDVEKGLLSTQWPAYELTMCGKRYIIARPTFANPSTFGRCTRGYLAYELDAGSETGADSKAGTGAVRFLKDSWRLDREGMRPEHKVYERLQDKGVRCIATCLAHEDVFSGGSWQRTTTQSVLERPLPALGHYRLLLEEVCRPLTDFTSFKELAALMCYAIIAHRDAWEKAEVLHRDISVSNILIFEQGRGKVSRPAILCDWDLCKFKEHMIVKGKLRIPDNGGTWYFRSALSLKFPCRPHRLSDDIESFIHVYHYCVLRFHQTNWTCALSSFFEGLYEVYVVRAEDGAHIGSEGKLRQMQSTTADIRPEYNETLLAFLTDIAKICSEHYASIDLDELKAQYDPPKLARPSRTRGVVPANNAAKDLLRMKRQQRYADVKTAPPAAQATSMACGDPDPKKPAAEPKLNDHTELLDLFYRYATGGRDEQGRVILWPARSTKCDDLFKGGTRPVLVDRYAFFWVGSQDRKTREDSDQDERPAKKRKANDGSVLPQEQEEYEEEEQEQKDWEEDWEEEW